MNALKVLKKKISDIKIVICGLGAAGTACIKLLNSAGARNIIGIDSTGILYKKRAVNMNVTKEALAEITNPSNKKGTLEDAIKGADVFIGVSNKDILSVDMIKQMSKRPIVFALANPMPEIDPYIAAPHVAILATGRSDYHNQINNALCFPGLFKGLLAGKATTVNHKIKIAAAKAIASVISKDELSEDYIIPSIFDKRVVENLAGAVMKAVEETGVARKQSN